MSGVTVAPLLSSKSVIPVEPPIRPPEGIDEEDTPED